MTERDMQRLEIAIGRTLPLPVRTFFLNFPPVLRALADGLEADDFALFDDAETLIEMNLPGRHFYQPSDWTSNVFILGAGGCGETFWVDLNSELGTVHRFEAGQEARDSDELADSLEEFAQGMIGGDE